MINKRQNNKNLDFIREKFNQNLWYDSQYLAFKQQAKSVKMSAGATQNSLYGLFPPHKDVQILLDATTLGKITTHEENIDFKYYFDEEDRVTMIERYDPTSQYNSKLVNTIFVEHGKREINALFCKGKSGNISTVAQCKLDLYGRLIRYMECTCGVGGYPYVYSVMRLKYIFSSIKIKHSVYSIWQEGDETLVSERKFTFRNGNLKEKTK